MKLSSVRVQHFRSIVDSGKVDIEDRVTVLIGKNEQGKTTFLKGIAAFSTTKQYVSNDLPNHLRVELERKKGSEIPVTTLYYQLDDSDRMALSDAIENVSEVSKIVATKYFDNSYSYKTIRDGNTEHAIEFTAPDVGPQVSTIRKTTDQLRTKIQAHAQRLPAFASHLPQAEKQIETFLSSNFSAGSQLDDLLKTLQVALSGVPGQDAAIQEDISNTVKDIRSILDQIKQALSKDPAQTLRAIFPHFVVHSTSVDRIPNNVNLSEFINEPDKTSPGMAKLCRVAGISIQKIQELSAMDAAAREAYEDSYRRTISGAVNEYWTQEIYNIHFRIEKENLSVSISDGKYAPRIPPSERSDGFQWYLSFYSTLLDEVSSSKPIMLLLDNPALELHPDGQRDIKKFLEERYSSSAQVLYVTHSPAMLDPFHLEQVRVVELHKDMVGTKVGTPRVKSPKDFDLLEPIRSAIGASLVTSLAYNCVNVLTEGAADKPILDAAITNFRPKLKESWVINGGIAEGKDYFPAFLERAKVPYVIFLDSDSGGRTIQGHLTGAGIPEGKILMLREAVGTEMFKDKDVELEDVISAEFYHRAVTDTYSEKEVTPVPADRAKRTKYYEEQFRQNHRIGFNKNRVAETMKRLIEQGKSDDQTKEQLEKVLKFLEMKISTQIQE